MPPGTCGLTSASLDQYNFAPTNYFQRPDTRYLFNAFLHYDVLPQVRAYAEFDFMNDRTFSQIAPSGSFFQTFTFNNDNPLLSQSFKDAAGIAPGVDQQVYIGRRNVEGGGRQDNFTFNNFRVVLGAKGSFYEDKWDYNAWWQSGRNSMSRQYLNDFSVSRLAKAFNVVTDRAHPPGRRFVRRWSTGPTRSACPTTSSTSAALPRPP